MNPRACVLSTVLIVAGALVGRPAGATLSPHDAVAGGSIEDAEVRGPTSGADWKAVAWDDLGGLALLPGRYEVRVRATAGGGVEAVELPVCAVRKGLLLDGEPVESPARAPAVVALGEEGPHEITLEVDVGVYEHRIACGAAPRAGTRVKTHEGLGALVFDSPHGPDGGGGAVVFVPAGHDWSAPAPLLVGTHPWNSDRWTYAAYRELLRTADERDVVLLMPDGLGNSLYIAKAEDEVMRAIAALEAEIAVDLHAVSIWGASMGGAGATTIGFHHPDHFATITSFFGDSKYDVTTYVRSLLPDDATAHRVNALDIVENARQVPVWLIHGDADATSPIKQSVMLWDAMRARGFDVRFDRIHGRGHEGALVAHDAAEIVERASTMRAPATPSRVTYWSVRKEDTGAYGVGIERARDHGDAYVDVELVAGVVHVRRARGVRAIVLARGALGVPATPPPRIVVDAAVHDGPASLDVRWQESPAP
jgi:pimeloyl-ACP methyl ester carboxylesterase